MRQSGAACAALANAFSPDDTKKHNEEERGKEENSDDVRGRAPQQSPKEREVRADHTTLSGYNEARTDR